VVCGIDGSGKSTQISNLARYLEEKSYEVVKTRQPTDMYRQDAVVRAALNLDISPHVVAEELALFSAFDRARHIREVINPALAQGKIVLSDRYVYSTFAYFLARGLTDIEWLKLINRSVPIPSLTFYIDVDPEVAKQRIISRDGNSRKREEIDMERMTRVRRTFLDQPWGEVKSYVIVDGQLSIDSVWARIRSAVDVALAES